MNGISVSWATYHKDGQFKRHYKVLCRSFYIRAVYLRVDFDPYYHRQDTLMNTGEKEDGRKTVFLEPLGF